MAINICSKLFHPSSQNAQRLAFQVFGNTPSTGVRKVVNTSLAKNEIVQHKNCNFLAQFDKGKKKHQNEMNFVEKLQEEEGIGG
jgi:hypothetical protein